MTSTEQYGSASATPSRPDGTPIAWWKSIGAQASALILAFGLLALIWLLARPLALIFLSIVLAAATWPVLKPMTRVMPRTGAVVILFLGLLLIIGLLLALIIPSVVSEADVFADRAPELLTEIEKLLRDAGLLGNGDSLEDRVSSSVSEFGTQVVMVPLAVFSGIIDLLLVVVVALYMLVEGPNIGQFFRSLMPPERRDQFQEIADEMIHSAGGYVRGVLWQGLVIGVASYIGFRVIGLEFPLFLAFLMALGEIVPNIGPLVSGGIAVATALLISPTAALITAAFALILQQIESNLITPYVMHKQVQISPLMVMIAVFAGGR